MTAQGMSEFIESLVLDEELMTVDRPVFYTCRDRLGHLYLALWCDYDADKKLETWYYIELSEKRLVSIKSGYMQVRDAFTACETGQVYVVDRDAQSSRIIDTVLKKCSQLIEKRLPDVGEYLDFDVETLPSFSESRLQNEALQAGRELVALRLLPPNLTRNEVSASLLGQILEQYQKIVSFIMQNDFLGKPGQRGTFSHVLLEQSQLAVIGTSGGSFIVTLGASSNSLFTDSNMATTLRESVELFEAFSNEAEVDSHLRGLGPRGSGYCRQLMQTLVSNETSLALYSASSTSSFKSARISYKQAEMTIEIIDRIRKEEVNLSVDGELVGGNYRTGHFEISVGEERFAGKVDTGVIEDLRSARLGQTYRCSLHVTQTTDATNKEKAYYQLLGLEPLNP